MIRVTSDKRDGTGRGWIQFESQLGEFRAFIGEYYEANRNKNQHRHIWCGPVNPRMGTTVDWIYLQSLTLHSAPRSKYHPKGGMLFARAYPDGTPVDSLDVLRTARKAFRLEGSTQPWYEDNLLSTAMWRDWSVDLNEVVVWLIAQRPNEVITRQMVAEWEASKRAAEQYWTLYKEHETTFCQLSDRIAELRQAGVPMPA